jgi:hypothetical protein
MDEHEACGECEVHAGKAREPVPQSLLQSCSASGRAG